LVLETTVSVTDGTGPKTASPLASAVGLAVWGIGSIAVATAAIRQ
jgi:ABC-2 type transport system permease protein